MKKICFVTATRAEYGLLKWLMKEIDNSDKFELQIIVTGGHLIKEQGYTITHIEADGFAINEKVDCCLDTSTQASIAESMGRMAVLFPSVFRKLKPDYLVVLGDRYELLPICNSAFVMRIPIIHISGGDVTQGAIDDGIRNAVTMLADYHFPGTKDSADNIIRMRGSDKYIWTVGELGLDAFRRERLMSRLQIADTLDLDVDREWVLFTYHAETKETLDYNLDAVRNSLALLVEMSGYQIVATYANADYGGRYINQLLEEETRKYSSLKVFPSLGQRRYLSYMKQVRFIIGNSSSGIVEAPWLKIPVVNIGNRQNGRHQCANIIQCGIDRKSIKLAIEKAVHMDIGKNDLIYWGDGHTAERIVGILLKEVGDRQDG